MNEIKTDPVEAIRHFTRFYTNKLGVLKDRLLDSAFSLTEARVIFELGHTQDLTARDLSEYLALDPGYLSRLLSGLRRRGVVEQTPSEEDRRRQILSLTEQGEAALAELEAKSRAEIEGVLTPLAFEEREKLTGMLRSVERILEPDPAQVSARPAIIRPHRRGELSHVLARQAALYAEEYDWDEGFEALLMRIGAEFHQKFDPARECLWIAERDGRIAGSTAVVSDGPTTARLRIVYVEPWARGLGLGHGLVRAAMEFARERGYSEMTLSTYSLLSAACRVYAAAGFEIVEEREEQAYGKALTSQEWRKTL